MSLTDTQCPFAQWLVLKCSQKEGKHSWTKCLPDIFRYFLKEKEFRVPIIILVFLSIPRVLTEDIGTMLQQTGKQK